MAQPKLVPAPLELQLSLRRLGELELLLELAARVAQRLSLPFRGEERGLRLRLRQPRVA